jgi:TPR repeat protein
MTIFSEVTKARYRRPGLGAMILCMATHVLAAGENDYEIGFKAYQSDDLITAMQYLRRASDQGNADAKYLLGYIFDKAEENAAALSYYLDAARNGSADAAYELGVMYSSGDGVARDYGTAVTWYEKAVALGHGPASETLGEAYYKGALGLVQDRERGRAILQKAADAGHDPARRLLDGFAANPAATN